MTVYRQFRRDAVIARCRLGPMTEQTEMLDAYDSQLRRYVPSGSTDGCRYELIGNLMRVTGQHRGFIDPAQDLGIDGEELDGLIRAQRHYFELRGEAVEWKTRSHDVPEGIADRLLLAGFVPEETETVMIAGSKTVATTPVLPLGITLRAVESPADLQRIADMQSVVWNADFGWLADDLGRRIDADPDSVVVYVAEHDSMVVSAAWLVVKPGTDFAGLWGGSTVPGWRHRGIYRALVAERAKVALELGVKYLQVDASADSMPILERLGFLPVTTTTPYVWTPDAG